MKNHLKFFGMTTVGARGQIVIPSQARRLFNIKSGDKLIVMTGPPHSKMISIAHTDDFARFINKFEKHISRLREEFLKKRQ